MPFAPIVKKSTGLLIVAVALAGLASCSSSRTEEVLQPTDHRPAPADKYPDFSKPLSSAMEQMSDKDAAKMSAELTALGGRRAAGQISEAEYWARVKQLQDLSRGTSEQ